VQMVKITHVNMLGSLPSAHNLQLPKRVVDVDKLYTPGNIVCVMTLISL